MDCEHRAHDEQGVTPFLSNSFIDEFGLVLLTNCQYVNFILNNSFFKESKNSFKRSFKYLGGGSNFFKCQPLLQKMNTQITWKSNLLSRYQEVIAYVKEQE